MSGTAYEDDQAGIRFVVPPGWRIFRHDLEDDDNDAATTTVIPLPAGVTLDPDTYSGEEVTTTPPDGFATTDTRERHHVYEDGWYMNIGDHRGVWVRLWQGLEQDPPDADDLLDAVEWLAEEAVNLEYLAPETVHGREFRTRRTTIHGHPAAAVWTRLSADEDDSTGVYLRLLLIQLASGRLSFIFGIADSDTDRRLIDDCLDSVEPLPPGPPGSTATPPRR